MIARIKQYIELARMVHITEEYSDTAVSGIRSGRQVRGGGLISGEDREMLSEADFSGRFHNREEYYKWYFMYLSNVKKMEALACIGELIKKGETKRIVSFGAGPGVLESILKMMFYDIYMVATDYDGFMVETIRQLLPELVAEKFDFLKDDPVEICNKHCIDTAILFGSACSMDSKQYLGFLKKLYESNCRNVLCFEAGVCSDYEDIKRRTTAVMMAVADGIRHRASYKDRIYHAWSRSESELMRIYNESGWQTQALNLHVYKYAFLLNKRSHK